MTLNLACRGYLANVRQWETFHKLPEENLNSLLPELANSHASAMAAGKLDMIEFEFLDEPDKNQRYFRIGINPAGMVQPIPIDL